MEHGVVSPPLSAVAEARGFTRCLVSVVTSDELVHGGVVLDPFVPLRLSHESVARVHFLALHLESRSARGSRRGVRHGVDIVGAGREHIVLDGTIRRREGEVRIKLIARLGETETGLCVDLPAPLLRAVITDEFGSDKHI